MRTDGMTMAFSVPASSMKILRALPVIGAVAVGVALTPGVAVTPSSAESPPVSIPACAQRIYARLFFGLEGPRGSVAEAEWDTFLRDVVVPRFPSGLTVTYAKGHWQAAGEPLQREASRVLEIVYDETPHHDRRIEEIAATYKATFQQESVMVIRMPASVCF
jgi:Protein of unknown function (DUF3574)